MEANHVEEYLQSARETRLTRQASMPGTTEVPLMSPDLTPMQENHPHVGEGEDPVFREGDELSEAMEDLNVARKGEEGGVEGNVKPGRHRKIYQPCTIPLRRDCTNLLLPEAGGEESVVAEDKVSIHIKTVRIIIFFFKFSQAASISYFSMLCVNCL